MWVGPQILEEKICIFGKKLVGPENAEEKKVIYGKKLVGGYQISRGTNFGLTFHKYLYCLTPPPLKGLVAFVMILPGQINSIKNAAIGNTMSFTLHDDT